MRRLWTCPRVHAWCGALVAGLLGLCLGCGGEKREQVSVIGSTSVQPFAEMLAEEFNKQNPGIRVDVQGGGSTAGIQAVSSGLADIGSCSRTLKPEETGFTTTTIARDGIAVIVHPTSKVSALTREQIRSIFMGSITRWSDVGGADKAIRVITREEGSGTREAFTHLVMRDARIAATALTQESNGAVRELVKNDPDAIGYMSLGLVQGVKDVQVDGVAPTVAEVVAGRYPLVRPFLFIVKGTPSEAAEKFIDFVLSAPAQQKLEEKGLVRAK